MVVPPQRDGGQAQFIRSAVPSCDEETLGGLLVWMLEHLDEPLTVTSLARTASMSERTFARRFRAETGTTPHAWLTLQRVIRAEELLETTDLSVERVADEVGFGGAAALRHHFTRVRGLSPQQYRRRFGRGGELSVLATDLAGARRRQGVAGHVVLGSFGRRQPLARPGAQALRLGVADDRGAHPLTPLPGRVRRRPRPRGPPGGRPAPARPRRGRR